MTDGRSPADAAETDTNATESDAVDPVELTAGSPAADTVADLAAAADRVAESEAAVDDVGESAIEAAADAHRQATRLLDSYADSATGTGDFEAYLTFQNRFLALVESLPEETRGIEGFRRASDRLDKRRLSEADFEFAREAIEPAGEAVAMLEEREAAAEAYRRVRHAATARLDELREEAAELREIRRLGEADLTTPLEPLSAPIEAYNDAVRTAFDRFRTDRSARELFSLLEAGADRPLVDVDRPPRELADYIETAPAGTEPLATLQTYADYSPSKLEHYVEDPGALRTNVAVHQTYLDRLAPEPFLVAWPPAEAATLRARLAELAPLCRRLDTAFESDDAVSGEPTAADPADGDTPGVAAVAAERDAVDPAVVDGDDAGATGNAADEDAASPASAGLTNRIEIARRTLWRLTRSDAYERLRAVAVADAELTDEEFERLAAGEIAADLAAVETGIEALEAALDVYALED